MIDVYQAASHMTDESGQSYPFTIDTLLDRALGPEGYYGVFTANMHTDEPTSSGSDAIVNSAQARGVPIVSARQMLTWLDARNSSSFGSLAWNGGRLTFTIDHAPGANGLRAMVPTASAVGPLTGVKLGGTPVTTTTRTIKGREYAFFDAAAGSYEATYAVDDTAPTIANVGHQVASDGTATVTWDTNEPSSSRVDFGTDPSSLTASVSNSTLVGAHSVQLTGLSSSTTYYYRVTSADAAANSRTEPAPPASPRSFTTPGQGFTDTTVADFTAGAPDANAQISQSGDGELILKPTVGEEFFGGPILPAGWESCPWTAVETCAAGTGATVSGGSLHINGTYARTVSSYGSGRSLEFVANFGGQSFEHAGFGVDLNGSPNWAIFSVTSSGAFAARTNNNGTGTETQLSSTLLGSPHRYRIEWNANDVRYYVDGALVATHTTSFAAQMRPIASDFNPATPELSLDWLRMSAYASSGSFDSRVFDAGAGQSADWGALTWSASAPVGTGVALSARTGDTPVPDATWTAFSPIAASGGDVPGSSRYVQYRAQLTTADPAVTPALGEVSIGYSAGSSGTVPETTIDSGPSGETEDSTPTFAFHSSVPGSTFACSIDTGTPNFAPCSGPGASHTPASPLSDGAYTFRVRATAAGGTDPTPATSGFTIHTPVLSAPTLTGTSPASPANANSPRVLGSAEPGAQVRIYSSADCSGTPLATGTAAALASPGITISVLDNTTTALRATATDGAGKTSACSTSAITYVEDSAAPNTTVSSGPSGPTNDSTPTFGFTSSESNSTFQCRFDTAAYAPCSGPGETHTPTTALSSGSHTFSVRAVDKAGNTDATPATRSFSVDTAAPNTTVSSGPSGPTNDSTPTFGFTSSESNSTFQCRFDSAEFAPCSGPGGAHTPTTALSEGAHTFSVRAVDQAGNIDASPATRSFSVDTVAPETTITSGPSGTTTDRTPTFAFSSSEAGSTFQCRLDTANFSSCSSPKTYVTLSFASHTFQVRATDGAGNVDATPAVRTFTVGR
jgi:Bacterial Ig-like domain/Purple acid Phosphatase, N-terminal domain/Glycosyl hydrolases family 16